MARTAAKEQRVNIKALLADMDRLIDSFRSQGRKCPRVTLDAQQFQAFMEWNEGNPYYRDVGVFRR